MLLTHIQLASLPLDEAFALKYERFINSKGKKDGNIEKDRAMEYRIGKTKQYLNRLGSNFKPKFVKNLTRSIDFFQDITEKLEAGLESRVSTTKHKNPSREKEVDKLVNFMLEMDIFKIKNSRKSSTEIQDIQLNQIDRKKLKKWAKETTHEISSLTCFQRNEVEFLDMDEFDFEDYELDEEDYQEYYNEWYGKDDEDDGDDNNKQGEEDDFQDELYYEYESESQDEDEEVGRSSKKFKD